MTRASLVLALVALAALVAPVRRAAAQAPAPGDGEPASPEGGADEQAPDQVPNPPPPGDGPSQMTRDRAELHLASARSHRAAGHPERALGDLVTAYELVHDPAILLEVASCHEELLQLPEALAAYEDLAALEDIDPALRARAEQRAATIRSRLAQLGVHPPDHDQDRDREQDRDEEPEQPVEEGMSTGRLVAHATTFGLAGAGLIVGGIFGILTVVEDGKLREGCGADLSCTGDDLHDIRIYRLAADVAFFASAIAALAGFLLVLTYDPGGGEDEPEDASASVAPWLSPDGGGVVAAGRF